MNPETSAAQASNWPGAFTVYKLSKPVIGMNETTPLVDQESPTVPSQGNNEQTEQTR